MSFGRTPFGRSPFASMGPNGSLYPIPGTPDATAPACLAVVDGDYVMGSDGQLNATQDPVDQEVAFRLVTILGTFSDPTIGSELTSILLYNAASEVETQDAVARALAPMIERGAIADLQVVPTPTVQGGSARNAMTITYRKTGIVET